MYALCVTYVSADENPCGTDIAFGLPFIHPEELTHIPFDIPSDAKEALVTFVSLPLLSIEWQGVYEVVDNGKKDK